MLALETPSHNEALVADTPYRNIIESIAAHASESTAHFSAVLGRLAAPAIAWPL